MTISSGCNFNTVSKEILEDLVKLNVVDYISISIDGASQKIYEKYRRNGNLNQVLENIRLLNSFKEKYQSIFPKLNWQYILFAHNEDEVLKAKQMANELNMSITYKLDWDKGKEFVPKDTELLRQVTGLEYFSRAAFNKFFCSPYLAIKKCSGMIFSPQINYDGRLLGCCSVYANDWKVNVFDIGLIKAVNNEKYLEAVKMILGDAPICDRSTPCGQCSNWRRFRDGLQLSFTDLNLRAPRFGRW